MYTIDIITSTIKTYFELENKNITGKERIDLIFSIFSVHINTLYGWIKKYYNKITKIFDFSTFKTKYHSNNTKLTDDIELFIINSIDHNNNFNVKHIINQIATLYDTKLSKSTIYQVLHKNNLTYKKIVVKNIPYTEEKLNVLKHDLKIKLDNIDEFKLFSYDEMAIYLNDKPYRGWSKKGTDCIINTKNKSIFNKRYTVGMAINKHGYIDFTCVAGALNGNKFNTFMNKINKNGNIVFMDNASIHKNIQFQKYIEDTKFNVVYNIPYHSELNPIEYVFSLLRKKLLSNINNSFDSIIQTIVDFKKSINENIVHNIFEKCFKTIRSYK